MKKLLLAAGVGVLLVSQALAQDPPKANTPAEAPTLTVPYTNFALGLSFDHPAIWKLVEDPKEKKRLLDLNIFKKKPPKNTLKRASDETLFYIPVGDRTATLEIFGALYDQTPELWEEVQQQVNSQLNRKIEKQWREEIMGVPLLLTKLSYPDEGETTIALSGLVYSRTPYKLQFRLTAPSIAYDQAEYELRQALQSIKTVQGDLPQAEDPNNPLTSSAYINKPTKPPKVTVLGSDKPEVVKIKKGEVAIPLTVSERKLVLTLPAGWTFDAPQNGVIVLHNPAVSGTVTVSVYSTLDSDPPEAAIIKASGASLNDYASVALRQEVQRDSSLAGAKLNAVWRTGQASAGTMTTCDAVGATGDNYWVLRYRLQGPPNSKERKLIEALTDGMSADPAP